MDNNGFRGVSRRNFLQGAGSAGLTAVAGCLGDDSDDGSSGNGQTPPGTGNETNGENGEAGDAVGVDAFSLLEPGSGELEGVVLGEPDEDFDYSASLSPDVDTDADDVGFGVYLQDADGEVVSTLHEDSGTPSSINNTILELDYTELVREVGEGEFSLSAEASTGDDTETYSVPLTLEEPYFTTEHTKVGEREKLLELLDYLSADKQGTSEETGIHTPQLVSLTNVGLIRERATDEEIENATQMWDHYDHKDQLEAVLYMGGGSRIYSYEEMDASVVEDIFSGAEVIDTYKGREIREEHRSEFRDAQFYDPDEDIVVFGDQEFIEGVIDRLEGDAESLREDDWRIEGLSEQLHLDEHPLLEEDSLEERGYPLTISTVTVDHSVYTNSERRGHNVFMFYKPEDREVLDVMADMEDGTISEVNVRGFDEMMGDYAWDS